MSERLQVVPMTPIQLATAPFAPSSRSEPSRACDFPTTLLAMVGHDLRQPLQIMTSAHDVLATMLAEAAQREELARAADATSRLATMLNQIVEALQLYEISCGCRIEPVLLAPVLADMADEFHWPARTKDISLKIGASDAAVLSHPVLLRGILRNLLRNAVEYTPPGGRVAVACRRRGGKFRIAVCDNGVGIRGSALASVFGAFARDDRTRGDGLGLGLFIAKRAADFLGHRIAVRSVPGRGSCFTVSAELADRAVNAPVPRRRTTRTLAGTHPQANPLSFGVTTTE